MKVVSKQNNSNMCLICGINNKFGVKASFYNMEDGSVGGLFTFLPEHQSYPDRVHGGMISTMIDELAGRALWVTQPDKIAVTIDLSVKYRKPVPYGVRLIGKGVITEMLSRAYTAKCAIMDSDGNVLADGTARYFMIPVDKISDAPIDDEINIFVPDDVKEIDFSDKWRIG